MNNCNLYHNFITILSEQRRSYTLVQATENGQPRKLPLQGSSFRFKLHFTNGVPDSFGAEASNTFGCPLQQVGGNQWKAKRGDCSETKVGVHGQRLKDEEFYFSVLGSGTLTVSDDFKNVTADWALKRPPSDKRTLLFRLEERASNE